MKSKRKNKKVYVLRQLMRIRGLNAVELGVKVEVSHPTVNNYIRNPQNMDGNMRLKMALALKVGIEKIDDVCNGVIINVEQLLSA